MYLNLLPQSSLFLCSFQVGLGVRVSSSLTLKLPRPIPGPQLTDTQGVLMDTKPSERPSGRWKLTEVLLVM